MSMGVPQDSQNVSQSAQSVPTQVEARKTAPEEGGVLARTDSLRSIISDNGSEASSESLSTDHTFTKSEDLPPLHNVPLPAPPSAPGKAPVTTGDGSSSKEQLAATSEDDRSPLNETVSDEALFAAFDGDEEGVSGSTESPETKEPDKADDVQEKGVKFERPGFERGKFKKKRHPEGMTTSDHRIKFKKGSVKNKEKRKGSLKIGAGRKKRPGVKKDRVTKDKDVAEMRESRAKKYDEQVKKTKRELPDVNDRKEVKAKAKGLSVEDSQGKKFNLEDLKQERVEIEDKIYNWMDNNFGDAVKAGEKDPLKEGVKFKKFLKTASKLNSNSLVPLIKDAGTYFQNCEHNLGAKTNNKKRAEGALEKVKEEKGSIENEQKTVDEIENKQKAFDESDKAVANAQKKFNGAIKNRSAVVAETLDFYTSVLDGIEQNLSMEGGKHNKGCKKMLVSIQNGMKEIESACKDRGRVITALGKGNGVDREEAREELKNFESKLASLNDRLSGGEGKVGQPQTSKTESEKEQTQAASEEEQTQAASEEEKTPSQKKAAGDGPHTPKTTEEVNKLIADGGVKGILKEGKEIYTGPKIGEHRTTQTTSKLSENVKKFAGIIKNSLQKKYESARPALDKGQKLAGRLATNLKGAAEASKKIAKFSIQKIKSATINKMTDTPYESEEKSAFFSDNKEMLDAYYDEAEFAKIEKAAEKDQAAENTNFVKEAVDAVDNLTVKTENKFNTQVNEIYNKFIDQEKSTELLNISGTDRKEIEKLMKNPSTENNIKILNLGLKAIKIEGGWKQIVDAAKKEAEAASNNEQRAATSKLSENAKKFTGIIKTSLQKKYESAKPALDKGQKLAGRLATNPKGAAEASKKIAKFSIQKIKSAFSNKMSDAQFQEFNKSINETLSGPPGILYEDKGGTIDIDDNKILEFLEKLEKGVPNLTSEQKQELSDDFESWAKNNSNVFEGVREQRENDGIASEQSIKSYAKPVHKINNDYRDMFARIISDVLETKTYDKARKACNVGEPPVK